MVSGVTPVTTVDPVPFHVVFVCTGNRARSALAEAFFRTKSAGDAVRVESYGTLEFGPEPAMPHAIAAAASFGVDLRDHRARSLLGVRLDDVDLVIGFEPFHVAAAVVEAGARKERAFMFRELAALLEDFAPVTAGLGSARSQAAVDHAHARRAGRRSSALSLADPYAGSRRVYDEVAATIDDLTSTLAMRLFGTSTDERPSARTRDLGVA